MFNLVTGQIVPARCKANGCPYCGRVNARLVGGAITLAGYERSITLTQVGDDWQTVRGRMRRLRYFISATGCVVEWAWHVEPNPAATGHHVHAFQRGSFIPQARLSDLARRCGMGGYTYIKRHRSTGRAQTYGVKLAGMPYGMKAAESVDTLDGYLAANGKRLVHASRGFWKDETGAKVGQREAMAAWARQRNDGTEDDPTWQLVPAHQIQRAALRASETSRTAPAVPVGHGGS